MAVLRAWCSVLGARARCCCGGARSAPAPSTQHEALSTSEVCLPSAAAPAAALAPRCIDGNRFDVSSLAGSDEDRRGVRIELEIDDVDLDTANHRENRGLFV